MKPYLFVTDLDNTLVGDDEALKELNTILSQHRKDYGTKIVYATGRSRFLYSQLTTEREMLAPDALICSVGTEIYFNPDEDILDPEWADILSAGWNREEVIATAAHFSDLTPQQESEQGRFKVSYDLSEEVAVELIPRLKSALAEKGLETKIIFSGGENLDILPKNADKGLAVQHLRSTWDMNGTQTLVCGDSGNDIALFSVKDANGIIVGNALSELRQWYQENKTDKLYSAQACCAGGILEGLKHFNFL